MWRGVFVRSLWIFFCLPQPPFRTFIAFCYAIDSGVKFIAFYYAIISGVNMFKVVSYGFFCNTCQVRCRWGSGGKSLGGGGRPITLRIFYSLCDVYPLWCVCRGAFSTTVPVKTANVLLKYSDSVILYDPCVGRIKPHPINTPLPPESSTPKPPFTKTSSPETLFSRPPPQKTLCSPGWSRSLLN